MNTGQAIHLLPQTNQLRALHSIIRNKHATQDDFVFYSDQIFRLLLETGTNLLPFTEHQVTTPVGETYNGLKLDVKLCAVSVIRAGESMETELRSMHWGMPMGKILIQRDKQTKLPKLFYSNLPEDINERHVLLLEPMLATGGSALSAIEVLIQAGVKEKNIIFINLLTSPEGLERVLDVYPKLRVVTSSIEQRLNEHAFMIPGIGDFGDRYFGTADSGAK
ncbi:uracil phosphoribosyltransferase [uncultured Shewanella sp.]|uniref:uracil phosphoribosyltransferase n=1 Tax=uncultured Shewanella sp. TaxID=173975 RepID=UPI0026104A4E|nr:uracil phosphoribosyltransferase [uncultured Shewanella sp.]